MSKDRHAELIKLLRSEFGHSVECKGKVESQWLMRVSLVRILSRETTSEYLVRVTVKISESPYIEGIEIIQKNRRRLSNE